MKKEEMSARIIEALFVISMNFRCRISDLFQMVFVLLFHEGNKENRNFVFFGLIYGEKTSVYKINNK